MLCFFVCRTIPNQVSACDAGQVPFCNEAGQRLRRSLFLLISHFARPALDGRNYNARLMLIKRLIPGVKFIAGLFCVGAFEQDKLLDVQRACGVKLIGEIV
jgi:hypothetical protein